MRIPRWTVVLALGCWALGGCASTGIKEVGGSSSGGDMGYVLERGDVRFVFEPGVYDFVSNGHTGQWVLLREIEIRSVSLAGEFNGWSTSAWPMASDGVSGYVLKKRAGDLGNSKSSQFKFVVNGEWWVEPPPRAPNRTATGFENQSSNFVLTLP